MPELTTKTLRALFMALYHPAFLLRDPRKKAVMWEHAKKLRAFLNERGWMPSGRQR